MNIVITGANRGIGLELARYYAGQGAVYGLCRSSSAALAELPSVTVIEQCDLTDAQRMQKGIQQCPDDIDVLICNAGIYDRKASRLGSIDETSLVRQFSVNAAAPLLFIQSIQDRLRPGAKIALISSRMGSIADNQSGGAYGYRMSKAAMNAMGVSLARDLQAQQIAVLLLHPGHVQTDMTGHTGQTTPQQAAQQLAQRIDKLTLASSGQFQHANGEILPW